MGCVVCPLVPEATADEAHIGLRDEIGQLPDRTVRSCETTREIFSSPHQHECDDLEFARIDGTGIACICRAPQYSLVTLCNHLDVLLKSVRRKLLRLIKNAIELGSRKQIGEVSFEPKLLPRNIIGRVRRALVDEPQ